MRLFQRGRSFCEFTESRVGPNRSGDISRMRVITSDGERIETHANARNIHRPLIEDFANAVLENRDPVVTGEIGRAVAMLEEEIYQNSANKNPVNSE